VIHVNTKEGAMISMHVAPVHTFADGSQLFIATRYFGEKEFACELYVSHGLVGREPTPQPITTPLVAPTCQAAQKKAYAFARKRYRRAAEKMKPPPYPIWSLHNDSITQEHRGFVRWRNQRGRKK
jgi:hypothetical protein